MLGAAMPEATVHEDCHLPPWEGDIHADSEFRKVYSIVRSEAQPRPVKRGSQCSFRSSIDTTV
jgi:hypothetical protein